MLETTFPSFSAIVRMRFGCGLDVVRTWFGRGSDVVRTWFGRGSDVGRRWLGLVFGSGANSLAEVKGKCPALLTVIFHVGPGGYVY